MLAWRVGESLGDKFYKICEKLFLSTKKLKLLAQGVLFSFVRGTRLAPQQGCAFSGNKRALASFKILPRKSFLLFHKKSK